MKKAYDVESAGRLVPFLQATHREIRERADRVRRLENKLRLVGADDPESTPIQADLSTQRREIRQAKRDLSRLGCEIDELGTFQVLIPGVDGRLESGYLWAPGDTQVRTAETDTAA